MIENLNFSIAYAGKSDEYELSENKELTLLERKINNAVQNNLNVIQVRINDIIEYEKKYGARKLSSYLLELRSKGLEISVHLPSPIPDIDNKLNFNLFYQQLEPGLKLLAMSNVTKYTIHPHYNKIDFNRFNPQEQQIILENMSKLFANIINTLNSNKYSENPILAIENVPVRDANSYTILPNDNEEMIKKKQKAQKNISYGMTKDELKNILSLTRSKIKTLGFDNIDENYQIGVTFDTGHAASLIPEENKKAEIKSWIDYFAKDIRLYHIAPRGEHNLDKTEEVMSFVQAESAKRNINATAFVENHYPFKTNNEIANICHKLNDKTLSKDDKENKENKKQNNSEKNDEQTDIKNISNNKSNNSENKKSNRILTGLRSKRINIRNNFNIHQNPKAYETQKDKQSEGKKNDLNKNNVKKLTLTKPNLNSSNTNSSKGFVSIFFLLILMLSACCCIPLLILNFFTK